MNSMVLQWKMLVVSLMTEGGAVGGLTQCRMRALYACERKTDWAQRKIACSREKMIRRS